MLDATFLAKSAEMLELARDCRRIATRYRADRNTFQRNTDNARRALSMARYYNRRAALYTKGDDMLRVYHDLKAAGMFAWADMCRATAERFFHLSDTVPHPLA